MLNNPRVHEYWKWLCSKIDVGAPSQYQYQDLYKTLFRLPFDSGFGNDINRAEDGIELRANWLATSRYDDFGPEFEEGFWDWCSMFEAIIGLAIRMNQALYNPNWNRTGVYFWELLRNVRFDKFDDWYISETGRLEIFEICDVINLRKYDRNGTNGGLFPIPWTHENMPDLELWYQLQQYLIEKH